MFDVLTKMTAKQYYSDDFNSEPSLSSTTANLLVRRSAFHGWLYHPRLGRKARKATDAMERGTILDMFVLGSETREVDLIDAPDFRTKAAQAQRDASKAAWRVPLLRHKAEAYQVVAQGIKDRCESLGLTFDGMSQVCLLWEETATSGRVVQCRALLDHLFMDTADFLDLKTAENCHPEKLPWKVYGEGALIQMSAYKRAVNACLETTGARGSWVFAEADDQDVVIAGPDGQGEAYGDMLWQRAVDMWAEALDTNQWHGYQKPGERLSIGVPPKALDAMLAALEASAGNGDAEGGSDGL